MKLLCNVCEKEVKVNAPKGIDGFSMKCGHRIPRKLTFEEQADIIYTDGKGRYVYDVPYWMGVSEDGDDWRESAYWDGEPLYNILNCCDHDEED